MSEALAQELAGCKGKGYVIAPAGYGKTHLIATAIKLSTRRQLVLTHTYAGVHALKKKMQLMGVPTSLYHIDTVASWSLRMSLSFPATSGWNEAYPSGKQWTELYLATAELMKRKFISRILSSSYGGFYVDEYQDCSNEQHLLVEAVAQLLPCRLLGDPMQAIFEFDKPVDWDVQIYPYYDRLGQLEKPWRWDLVGAGALGQWLKEARELLESGKPISLTAPLPEGVTRINVDLDDYTNPKRFNFFYKAAEKDGAVIAIHAGDQLSKNKTHGIARSLAGRFSSIEEIEGKDLASFIKKIEKQVKPNEKLKLAIEFSKKCMTAVEGVLSAATKKGEIAKITKATKYPALASRANEYLADQSSKNLSAFFEALKSNPETSTYRRDLLNRFIGVLRTQGDSGGKTLAEALQLYQQGFRNTGRPLRHDKIIGTTLLVKGLEYEHAIVLQADAMSAKELYVALTRGARSVTIVSVGHSIPAQF